MCFQRDCLLAADLLQRVVLQRLVELRKLEFIDHPLVEPRTCLATITIKPTQNQVSATTINHQSQVVVIDLQMKAVAVQMWKFIRIDQVIVVEVCLLRTFHQAFILVNQK